MKPTTVLLVFILLYLTVCIPNTIAQHSSVEPERYFRVSTQMALLFKSPAIFMEAETGTIRQESISYSLTGGIMLFGAEHTSGPVTERMNFMAYFTPGINFSAYINPNVSIFSRISAGPAVMNYYWRINRFSTTSSISAVVRPEIGLHLNVSERFRTSYGFSVMYGRILQNSSLEDRPNHFTAFPVFRISFSYHRSR